jgi:hypothetical protein
MKNWYWMFMVLSLALAAQGCTDSDDGGGSGGSAGTGGTAGSGGTAGDGGTGGDAMDADRDGIPDEEDPTPNGSTNNKLNGTNTGGAAAVVETTATLGDGSENVDFIYGDDLTTGCDTSWDPQGTLCDEPDTTDSPTTSTKTDSDSGATWLGNAELGVDEDPPVTGFLVVDACSDASCEAVDFNEARVFQMFSDGKTTHLRMSIHTERGDTAPAWDDAGWTTITGFETIGEGTNIDDFVVEDPTVLSTGPRVTRYVRFEARNDGSLPDDDASYIELRSVKLFSVSAPE